MKNRADMYVHSAFSINENYMKERTGYMPRTNKITFKISNSEREELNHLMLEQACNISDLIRLALKMQYDLKEFEPSYCKTASKVYESRWTLY